MTNDRRPSDLEATVAAAVAAVSPADLIPDRTMAIALRLAADEDVIGLAEDAGCSPGFLADFMLNAIADVGGVVHDSNMDSNDDAGHVSGLLARLDANSRMARGHDLTDVILLGEAATALRALSERVRQLERRVSREAAEATIELLKAGLSTTDVLAGGLDGALSLAAAEFSTAELLEEALRRTRGAE